MRLQSLLVLSIYSVIFLPNPVFAQWDTHCNLRDVDGARVLDVIPVASVGYQGSTFKYAIAKMEEGDIPVIFREKNYQCWRIFADRTNGTASLSEGVPVPVANFFALVRMKKRVTDLGFDRVQEFINQKSKIYAEDAYAANKLGLKVQKYTTKVIPYSTKPRKETKTDEKEDRY
jgi:hypothetical protein